jgi:diguanylate cyclase (GGDEF)-like protein
MSTIQQSESESTSRRTRILHLEDNEFDLELVRSLLEKEDLNCEITPVETQADFVRALESGEWDLILSDYALPSFNGLEALAIAVATCPNTPFIFVTGTLGEDIAVESLKVGATDYVLKQRMARLSSSVRRALKERAERLRRELAERELERSEEQLRYLAYHDSLTRLPNRALLQDRLEQAIAGARRDSSKVALLFVDLDNFKDVNDSLGHPAGDLVLQQVAERLRRCARECDTVARQGGDEFLVVLDTVKDSTDAVIAADRIRRTISSEICVHGVSLSTTCSVGISLFPDNGGDAETLFRNADIALARAKESGRNELRHFTEDMHGQALERLTLEHDLRRALDLGQFFLEYQPQLDLSTGKIVGAEALLRWRHPRLGMVPPSKFIPMAECIGEIVRIGKWVLQTACAQTRQWQEEGIAPLVMAVNVSAVQFRDESLLCIIQDTLDETGLAPQYLELEVTETLLISNASVLTPLLQRLSELGTNLVIDDFGTGYCGLSYLRRFHFSKLKIDQSFVRSILTDKRDAMLTAAIINIAKLLDMEVIAECVETGEQLELLRSLACDAIQGFHFSRPLSTSDFAEKFRTQRALLPA